MKKIALYIAIAVVSFVVGLIGLYVAMPYLQPDKVDAVRAELDSLRSLRADSLLVDDLAAEVDLVLSDTLAADSLGLEFEGPIAIPLDEHPRFIALMDSVASLAALFQAAEEDRSRLIGRLDAQEAAPAQPVSSTTPDLAELAATLSRLEENELKPILDRVDDTTIRQLYDESTGRNRTKLLRSMNPDRAARLVQRMVGRPAPPPTQPASVTTAPDTDRASDATE